jgi:hypothetical protein
MIAAIYARTSAAIRTVMRHLILGLGGLGLLVTATPATGEAAWVFWVSPYHYDPDGCRR